MTGPVGTGYPDDVRTQQWNAPPFVNQNAVGAAATVLGPFFVGAWASLRLFAQDTSAHGAAVSVTWYADAALTVPVGAVTVALAVNTSVDTVIDNQGNYATLTVAPAGGLAATVQLFLAPTNMLPSSVMALDSPVLGGTGGDVNVGAGVIRNDDTSAIVIGEAMLNYSTTAAAWILNVFKVDEAGGLSLIWRAVSGRGAPAADTVRIPLPAAKVRIQFANNDAAIRLYSAVIAAIG